MGRSIKLNLTVLPVRLSKEEMRKMRKKRKIHAFSLVFIFHFGEIYFVSIHVKYKNRNLIIKDKFKFVIHYMANQRRYIYKYQHA